MIDRVDASGNAIDHLRCFPSPAERAASERAPASSFKSDRFESDSKEGLTNLSEKVTVAPRFTLKPCRALSSCTTVTLPRSIEAAAVGYRGETIFPKIPDIKLLNCERALARYVKKLPFKRTASRLNIKHQLPFGISLTVGRLFGR